MKGETIDYRTNAQYKVLDAIEYILDHSSDIDDDVFDLVGQELSSKYVLFGDLDVLIRALWKHLVN